MPRERGSSIQTTSCTEYPQYARLIEFTAEVSVLANEREDNELQELLDELATDLLDMSR